MNLSFLSIPMILAAVIAGIAGGLLMNLYMRMLTREHAVKADMVTLFGSLLTGSLDQAKKVGTTIHILAGAGFGVLYTWLLYNLHTLALPQSAFTGLGMGLAHGVVVGFILMILVFHRHPVEDYRQTRITLSVGLVYISAHGIYGVVVALVAGLFALIP